ncbi:MAG: hypothetical protein AAGL68_07290 [Pseudomonadota bacterium]
MLSERRHCLISPALLVRVGLAWVLVCSVLLIVNFKAISASLFPDPDDIMRLIQVRDLIGGQSWFDLTQYRVNSVGGGVPMHWSRLVDMPIAFVIVVLTPLFGSAGAEMAVLIIIPLLTLGIAMLLAARIAWRLLGEEEAVMTCLVIAMSIPLLFQFGPLRIDHHGWQIVCALAAMNGLMARNARAGGAFIGAVIAIWLSISIEGLPLAAAICGVVALRWLRDRNDRVWLTATIQSLAITGAVVFGLTRGIGDLATYCDAIGPVHLAMFGWGALVLTVLAKAEPLPRPAIWMGFGVAGGGAIALYLYSVPQCAGGGFSALDPLVEQYWYQSVSEGLPVWQQNPKVALQYAVAPLIAIFAAINLIGRSYDWLRRFWIEYTIVLIAAFVISLLVARAGAVAGALAAVPLAWQVRQWLRTIRVMRRPAPRVLAMAAVSLALLPALPVLLMGWAMPAKASLAGAPTALSAPKPKASSCTVGDSAKPLNVLKPGEVFAPLDISPQLLLETDHSVIATSHHRGSDAMRVVIETSIGSVADAKAGLLARGTDYVAICPNLAEPLIYAAAAPDGFAAQLVNDNAPEWLEPIALNGQSNLKVWRIKRD